MAASAAILKLTQIFYFFVEGGGVNGFTFEMSGISSIDVSRTLYFVLHLC